MTFLTLLIVAACHDHDGDGKWPREQFPGDENVRQAVEVLHLNHARASHTLTPLMDTFPGDAVDGDLLIAGGIGIGHQVPETEYLTLWNQSQDRQSEVAAYQSAVALDSGRVLFFGGVEGSHIPYLFEISLNPTGLLLLLGMVDLRQEAVVYEQLTDRFVTIKQLYRRIFHTTVAVKLDPHQDLLTAFTVGGFGSGDPSASSYDVLSSTEMFDALFDDLQYKNNVREGPPLHKARFGHAVTVLPDGSVLVSGGMDRDGNLIREMEVFDPQINSWTLLDLPQQLLPRGRLLHHALLLRSSSNNYSVAMVGGETGAKEVDLFSLTSLSFVLMGKLSVPRAGASVVPWQEGYLVIGGRRMTAEGLKLSQTADFLSLGWGVIPSDFTTDFRISDHCSLKVGWDIIATLGGLIQEEPGETPTPTNEIALYAVK